MNDKPDRIEEYKKNIEESKVRNQRAILFFKIALVVSLILFVISPFLTNYLLSFVGNGNGGLNRMASLGDSFGTINAFFSASAFILIFYSIVLTRQDITLQKEMLLLQMEENRESRDIAERHATVSSLEPVLVNLMNELFRCNIFDIFFSICRFLEYRIIYRK